MKGIGALTRRAALEGAKMELQRAGVESARLEAERLMCKALGVERHELVLDLDQPLQAGQAGKVGWLLSRRLTGEPLQHIEGEVHFRGLVLRSDARALIPRPETEQLVERIAAWATSRRPRTALDIGTGSGAIALTLVAEGIVERAVGLDVSRQALLLADENRERLGLSDRVLLRHTPGPVWQPVGPEERFDLIVSNPPYVSDAEMTTLRAEVRRYEPTRALVGGPEGLDVIGQIAAGGAAHLERGGALFLEIGASQGEVVRRLFEDSSAWRRVIVQRDLAGRDRFVRAEPI